MLVVVPFTLPSFAKINLHLRVLGKRDDGFHDIFTIFQTVSLCDELTFEEARGLDLVCDDPGVPGGDSNLIVKAAEELRHHAAASLGAKITLTKRIPMGGGLGGGSSNAAVTLIGLRSLWGLDLKSDELVEIAGRLGSDIPFFLEGGTALGTGRGTEIEPIPDFEAGHLLIVTPGAQVPTAAAYSGLKAQNLTSVDSNRILRVCRAEADSDEFYPAALRNDFEESVFEAYPEVGRVKQRLIDLGARPALMSGSGASVFGIFDNEETRRAAMKALDAEVNWRRFAVAAVSRSEYRARLGLGLLSG